MLLLLIAFSVHEYNTECLVFTYLPYHTTPQFLALLSILPAHPPAALRFLSPYIPSPTNPPRRVITYTAINTPAFFDALQSYITRVLETGHQTSHLLSFWSSTTVEAVFGMLNNAASGRRAIQDQRIEELVLRILPVLNSCMRVQHGAEAVAACYTIVIVLVNQARLGDKILDGLMEAVCLAHDEDSLLECLACLSVIAGERSTADIPTKVSQKLIRVPEITQKLQLVSRQCQVERLVLGCALGALYDMNRSNEIQVTFRRLIESHLLTETRIQAVFSALVVLLQDCGPGSKEQGQLIQVVEGLAQSEQLLDQLQAAAKHDQIDLEAFGLTFTKLLQVNQVASEVSDNEELPEAEDEPSELPLNIEALDILTDSFLDPGFDSNFDEVVDVFEQAVASKQAQNFLTSKSLERDNALQHSKYISCLIRTWCGPRSIAVRVAALKAAATAFKEIQSAYSLQNTIPYLIYALADPFPLIRRAAASCIAILSEHQPSASKGYIWGHVDLYGESSKTIIALKEGDLVQFLSSTLEPVLEECVMDSKFVITSVRDALEGSHASRTDSKPTLRTQSRTSIMSFLLSHITVTPLLRVRLVLLPICSFAGKISDTIRSNMLFPAVQEWCALPAADVISLCEKEKITLEDMERGYLSALVARDLGSVHLLQELILSSAKDREVLTQAAFDRIEKLWPSMKTDARLVLAQCLLDLSMKDTSGSPDQRRHERAKDTLRTVKLDSITLVTFLEDIPSVVQMPEQPPAKKRRRTSRNELTRAELTSPQDIQHILQRLTLVLELIESSSPADHPALFKSLFGVLGHLQPLQQQSGSELVYLHDIILSALTAMIDTVKVRHQQHTVKSPLTCPRSSQMQQNTRQLPEQISSLTAFATPIAHRYKTVRCC